MSGIRKSLIVVGLALATPLGARVCVTSSERFTKQGDHSSLSHNDDDRRSISVRWRSRQLRDPHRCPRRFGVKPDLSGFVGVEDGGWIEVQERAETCPARACRGHWSRSRIPVDGGRPETVSTSIASVARRHPAAMERRTAMFRQMARAGLVEPAVRMRCSTKRTGWAPTTPPNLLHASPWHPAAGRLAARGECCGKRS